MSWSGSGRYPFEPAPRARRPVQLKAEIEDAAPDFFECGAEVRARLQQVVGLIPAASSVDGFHAPIVADDVAVVTIHEQSPGAVGPEHRRRVDYAVVVPDLDATLFAGAQICGDGDEAGILGVGERA